MALQTAGTALKRSCARWDATSADEVERVVLEERAARGHALLDVVICEVTGINPVPEPEPEPEPALDVAFETLISIGLVFSFPIRIAGIVSFPSLFGIRLNTQVFSAFIRPFTTLF